MLYCATRIDWVMTLDPLLQMLLFIGVLGGVTIGLLLPLGHTIDRLVARLQNYLEVSGSADGQAATFYGPKWIRPITRPFLSAIEQFQQRERALSNELREVEIRHRVSEAERRQSEAVLHSLRDAVIVTNAFGDVVLEMGRKAAELAAHSSRKAS